MTDRIVRGICPGCHFSSLTLTTEGHIVCTRPDCPEPEALDSLLHAGLHLLPPAVKTFIGPGPYECPACEAAALTEAAHAKHPDRGLDASARHLHGQCRRSHPFTGRPCTCGCRTSGGGEQR